MSKDLKKLVTIIVEADPYEWPKEDISYDEVVGLTVPGYSPDSGVIYSVKYKRGRGNKPEGILVPGADVKVKEGMAFNVSATGQS